jgi:hypothetical protein
VGSKQGENNYSQQLSYPGTDCLEGLFAGPTPSTLSTCCCSSVADGNLDGRRFFFISSVLLLFFLL